MFNVVKTKLELIINFSYNFEIIPNVLKSWKIPEILKIQILDFFLKF